MSLKGSAQEQNSTKDEMQQLRSELQLMMGEKQSSMMHAMREMMAEFMRNNGRSESSSTEGSVAVGGSPRGAEPTAARETSAAVTAAGGVARGNTTAGRQATLRGDASRNFGATGRRGASVPVEVCLARGQPDQQRTAGEWNAYPDGELGGGYNVPLSRHLALKHTAVPSFSGLKT